MKTLENYNGKIYLVRNTFALKFNSGSFHYAYKEIIKNAFENGFIVGYDKQESSKMPWGMQHTHYSFENCTNNETIINKFNEFIK